MVHLDDKIAMIGATCIKGFKRVIDFKKEFRSEEESIAQAEKIMQEIRSNRNPRDNGQEPESRRNN